MKKLLLTLALLCITMAVSAHDCCTRVSARMVSYDGGKTCSAVFYKTASCPHIVSITYQVEGDVVRVHHMGAYETESGGGHVYDGRRDATLLGIECGDGEEYAPIVYASAWGGLFDSMTPDYYDSEEAIYVLMATAAIVGTIVWFVAAIKPTPPDYQNEYLTLGAGMGTSYGLGFGLRASARYHAIGAHLGWGISPFWDSQFTAGSVYSAGLQFHINRAYIDISHIGLIHRGNNTRYTDYGDSYTPSYTAFILGSNDVVRGRRWFMNLGFGVWMDNYTKEWFPSLEIGFGYRLFSNGYR